MDMKIVSGCEYLKLKTEAKTILNEMALEDMAVHFNMHDNEINRLKTIIIRNAKKFKEIGLSVQEIVELSSLSIEEIDKL